MGRTHNTVRNLLWGIISKGVTLFLPFMTRTVLIKTLGGEYLGLGSLFTSILGLLSLAELGVSSAIVSSMYKPIAENDSDTICSLMAFYKKAYRVIGYIIFFVGLCLLPFLGKLIRGETPADISIYWLYLFYLVNTSVSYFLFAYKNCLFAAHQRNDVNSKVGIFCTALQNILQIILLFTFENYYLYVLVSMLMTISRNLIVARLVDKAYPMYKCRGILPPNVFSDIKKRVAGLMLARVSNTIRSAIDSLFISVFLGLTAVAIYSNYYYIVSSVVGIITMLESAMVAGVGNSIAADSLEKNYQDFKKFTFMLQWIVGWCSICILCLIQPFMKIWLGAGYMFKDIIAVICACYLFVSCIGMIRNIYTQALGMWWSLKYLSAIDVFVNFFLNFILVKYYGAYGVLAATIIDISFMSIPWTTYFLFRDCFGKEKYKKYMMSIAKYFVIAAFAGGMTYVICSFVTLANGILVLAIRATICIVVPNVIYLIIFHKNKLFIESVSFVKTRFIAKKS